MSAITALADDSDLPTHKHESIKVQLKWRHQFQFAGFYTALEKGYYDDVGLDVELIEGGPEINPEEVVLMGDADFGVGTPEVLLSFAAGKPIVVLGVIFQHSPYSFLVTNESGIDDINDLVGRSVMIETQASELYAYLKREKVPTEMLTILPHTQSVDDLVSGKVGAISAYSSTEPYFLEAVGVPYKVFNPRSSGIDFYGDCIFTTEHLLNENPDLVKRFYSATIKGWEYAMDHPEEAIDLILEEWPTQSSREALRFESEKMEELMHTELIPIGYMYAGRWEHIRDTYIELGMLDEAISLDGFLYDADPHPDTKGLYWLLGGTLLTAGIALVILFPIWKLNKRLRKEVVEHQRTAALLIEAKEQAEKANQAKRQFVAQVSHDLRTPLNCILGFSELMHDDEKDIERRSYLSSINSAGKGLLSLVDELLHIDRIESGRVELDSIDFIIDDVLDSLVELLSPTAESKGVELVTCVEKPFQGNMVGDAEKLRQILLNLVGNAIKFTEAGYVSIRIEQGAPGWANIRIADSGPGIPSDIIGGIFEPFVRANNIRHKDGCGLGLTIVHRLAIAMGGTITADNTDQGAVFVLSLPMAVDSPKSLSDLSPFRDFQGMEVAVALGENVRAESAIANLLSLGANVSNFSENPNALIDCQILITDKDHQGKAAIDQFLKQKKPVVLIIRNHPMMTRRFLARYILEAGCN
ncbi:hypothetical protein GCM10007047_07050 [Cerasicoccus arenae]|uniref:histidine kinase n=2 Tax=Cerasicoccus arenae TaxID=424488 RepID=A0A8J3D9Q8_9BACT|nr:hypothetical protein GCM10007047_07050 [Cerasicoccus arenae]